MNFGPNRTNSLLRLWTTRDKVKNATNINKDIKEQLEEIIKNIDRKISEENRFDNKNIHNNYGEKLSLEISNLIENYLNLANQVLKEK